MKKKTLFRITNKTLESLSAIEIKIIREKFEIELSDTDIDLDRLKTFDITRERIRKIEEKALEKLHHKDDDPDAA